MSITKSLRSLLVGGAALALASCATVDTQMSAASPVVQTTYGQIQGQRSNGVYSFLGLHYGADTSGTNRFLPPKAPASWSGIRRASEMGNRCPQPPVNMPPQMATVLSFSDLPMSEDCLVLNVWSPRPGDGKKRPVMVWLHGGGFFLGSGGDKYYEGSKLSADQDVIVVTLNHRLNGFGYLTLGPEAGEEYAASGLVGMLDIVHALQWVHDNIAAFGGDPGNVTIFGQSGGGSKTTVLTAMPAAQGLFHKAIIMSGAAYRVGEPAAALAVRDKFLAEVGVAPGDVAALQKLPMDTLVEASARMGLTGFTPAPDGKILPRHPYDPEAPSLSASVPLMVGTTKDEATNVFLSDPTWQTMTEADLLTRVTGIAGAEEAPGLIALYRARAPEDRPMHIWTSIMTDQIFVNSSNTLMERKVIQGTAPTYAYRVDWETPVLDGILRAPHAVELPFVFKTVSVSDGLVGAGPTQDQMADLMSSTFAAFARTGNPNVAGLPQWTPYTIEDRATFIYDIPPKVVSDPDGEIRMYLKAHQSAFRPAGASPLEERMGADRFSEEDE